MTLKSMLSLMIVALGSISPKEAIAQNETASYRAAVPKGLGASLSRSEYGWETVTTSENECLLKYKKDIWGLYIYENDSLSKEQTFGHSMLDSHDLNWIMSAKNRKQACLDLLEKKGHLSFLDQGLQWWRRHFGRR